MESECGDMLRAALILSNRDTKDISSLSVRQRVEEFSRMEEYYSKYETGCARHMSSDIRNKDLATFRFAQLKAAYTLQTEILNESDGQLAMPVTRRFSKDEYEAFSLFDRFSALDTMKEGDIATALVNKNEQIYRIIKEWYNDQMDNFLKLLDPSEASKKISGMVSVAMRDRYNSRFQKIRAGIISYLNQDPGQLRKLFYNYEEMMQSLSKSERKRLDLEEAIRGILSGEEADSLFDEFLTLSSYVQRRDLVGIASVDIRDLNKRTRVLLGKIDSAKMELERERDKIDNDPDMRANNTLLENEKVRINATIAMAETFRERLVNEILKGLEDLAEISAQMEIAKKEGKLPEDECVTQAQAQLLKEQFFQDLRRSMVEMAPFTIRNPNTGLDFRVKPGERSSDNWRSEDFVIQAGPDEPKLYVSEMGIDLMKHGILSNNHGISVRAAVLFHERLNEKHKVDMYQVNLSDIAPLYARLIADSQQSGSFTYVMVGSPNGFAEDLLRGITGDGNGIQIKGRSLRIILRDLKTGKLYYDVSDPDSKNFATIAAGRDFQEKQIGLFKARTLVECEKAGVVRSALIQKITESSEDEVISAWKQLEKEKKGKIRKIEGETVFETALA
ncbi:MAG: hypothetical protein QW597_06475 [Thermoplasmataceae archaeon]